MHAAEHPDLPGDRSTSRRLRPAASSRSCRCTGSSPRRRSARPTAPTHPGTCQLRVVSISRLRLRGPRLPRLRSRTVHCPRSTSRSRPTPDLAQFPDGHLVGYRASPANAAACRSCSARADATSYDGLHAPRLRLRPDRSATGTFTTPDRRAPRPAPRETATVDCASAPGACSLVSTVVRHAPGRGEDTPIRLRRQRAASAAAHHHRHARHRPRAGPVGHRHRRELRARRRSWRSASAYRAPPSRPGTARFGGSGRRQRRERRVHHHVRRAGAACSTTRSFPPECRRLRECAAATARSPRSSYDGQDRASQAIDFDPSVPHPVPDTTVSPQFDLPDRAARARAQLRLRAR